jgi:hypothetical protein
MVKRIICLLGQEVKHKIGVYVKLNAVVHWAGLGPLQALFEKALAGIEPAIG